MCEHFVARAAEPFRLDELWPFTERLERFGLAGLRLGRRLARPRTAGSGPTATSGPSATTPVASAVGAAETTAALVHLRRPSRLSTLTLADTQPFDDPAGRFAFSHNGDLRDYRALRDGVPRAGPHPRPGRHRGRRALARGRLAPGRAGRGPPARPPRPVRRAGQPRDADRRDGSAYHYAGNGENPVFTFRLGCDRRRLDGHLLARPVALPVRRAGRQDAPAGPARHHRRRSTVDGTPTAAS